MGDQQTIENGEPIRTHYEKLLDLWSRLTEGEQQRFLSKLPAKPQTLF
jgi:hypothetical protein